MGLIRSLRRLVTNADIRERHREVMEKLEEGKRREAGALHRVAESTGDTDIEAKALEAEREAREIRRNLTDDIALDVFSGVGGRRGRGEGSESEGRS